MSARPNREQLFTSRSSDQTRFPPINNNYNNNNNNNNNSNNNDNKSSRYGNINPLSQPSHQAPAPSSSSSSSYNQENSQQSIGNAINGREQYQLANTEDQDPLQLEHMLGYAGDYRKTVLSLPQNDQLIVKR
jgi:hypothetical protein